MYVKLYANVKIIKHLYSKNSMEDLVTVYQEDEFSWPEIEPWSSLQRADAVPVEINLNSTAIHKMLLFCCQIYPRSAR